VFRFRIAVGIAVALGFLLVADAQTAAPGSPTLALPAWLAPFPGARDERTLAGADEISSAYQIPKSPTDVITHYRAELQKAEIRFSSSFDGMGTVLRCSEGKASCIVQIRERDDGTSVKVSYSPNDAAAQPAFAAPLTQASVPAPAPVAAAPNPKKAVDDYPGRVEVEYEITGTIHYANLTRKNADGSTEQRQEKLPYADKFFAPPGTVLYLSVQKARITKTEEGFIPGTYLVDDGITGVVHVVIRVGGKVFQEADASAPYGIATASGEIPK
jgi:hypothetical protein